VKLLRLTVRGLRSFTRETTIDLASLGEQGLFAIVGPTGAGKSTVLDGIFLALFGRSPRGEAGECVSAGALSLSVRLELAVERDGLPVRLAVERRFRWSKKREAGESSLGPELRGGSRHLPLRIEEAREGGWAPVDLGGRRPDEYLREAVVRVSMADFQQAVVLPQGQIDALLRAKPAERRTLVASLFRTEHLGQPLLDELRGREQAVRGELDRLGEAEREIQVGEGEEARAQHEAREAERDAAIAGEALAEAETFAVEQRFAERRCAARELAARALAEADRRLAAREGERAAIERGRRAAEALVALRDLARERGKPLDPFLAELEERRPSDDDADAVNAVDALEQRIAALRVREDERASALAALALAEQHAAIARAARVSSLERDARAQRVAELARSIAALDASRADAARSLATAAEALAQAEREQQHALATQERAAVALEAAKRGAAAAQLAERLREGEPCPVCGSPEHPGVDHRTTMATLDHATRALAAEGRLVEVSTAARELAAREHRQREQARSSLDAERARRAEEHEAAQRAHARFLDGQDRPRVLLDAEAEIERHRARAELSLAALPLAERERLLAEAPARTLAEADALARALGDRAREAERLLARLDRLRDREAALRVAARFGFLSLAEQRAAWRPDAELDARAAELEALAAERRRLAAVHDERARDAAIEVSELDARAAEEARDRARAEADRARARVVEARYRCDELARRSARALALEARAAELEPRADRLLRIQRLLAGNQLAELAAERHLEAVTRGAAALLRTLSGDRYALVRGPEGAFAVADASHAGIVRAPSTLSGGETFLVSLGPRALALRAHPARRPHPLRFLLPRRGLRRPRRRDARPGLDGARAPAQRQSRVIGMISHVASDRRACASHLARHPRAPRRLRERAARNPMIALRAPDRPEVAGASPPIGERDRGERLCYHPEFDDAPRAAAPSSVFQHFITTAPPRSSSTATSSPQPRKSASRASATTTTSPRRPSTTA
jgi:exonuclease SbcC